MKMVVVVVAICILAAGVAAEDDELQSLKPEAVLGKLDLDLPGLAAVKAAAERGNRTAALTLLRDYYRAKYPLTSSDSSARSRRSGRRRSSDRADDIVNHIFQWGPYEKAAYGPDVNWTWDPRGDIEWVAAVYRFYWAGPLAGAYRSTKDKKYARAFVELTSDWIAKHPLEEWKRTHPVYKRWRGFAWLDIQTGIRATNICRAFQSLVHAEAFTPEFLGILLASLYDHQVKTEQLPMGKVHNKAIFEQRGFVNVAYTFQEFRDTRRWMALAFARVHENFLAQTTTDGVQREWSFGYHRGVLRDAVEVMERMDAMGIVVPEDYRTRVRKMYDYIFAVVTPDLGAPMFGDASRSVRDPGNRTRLPYYRTLMGATALLGDPKYAARATLDRSALPEQKSYIFPEAGMYVLRNDWGPEQIHFGFHCSPRGISGHDQQDNGTFELYAYGRWLMPDTGFYTYGHDRDARQWHRQTQVHQTLTLDGKNTRVAGRHLLWHSSPELDAIVAENGSYGNLTHRRTVWFVDKRFFVLLDEAIGEAPGTLDLHFQLAPGDVAFDPEGKQAKTTFDDANVLVWSGSPVTMAEEEGWYAWSYGHREPRKAFRYRHKGQAPAAFLTLVTPYRGTEAPEVSAVLSEAFTVGADRVSLTVTAFGKAWEVGRDLEAGEAWCK